MHSPPLNHMGQSSPPSASFEQKPASFDQARFYVLCGLVGFFIGTIVLLGWALQIDLLARILPTFIAMNPATALALISGGLALVAPSKMLGVKRVGSLAVMTIACLKLGQMSGVFSWGVDEVLFSTAIQNAGRPSSLMTSTTASALLLLGCSLLLNTVDRKPAHSAAQITAGGAAFLSLLAIFGYALGLGDRFDTLTFVPMALPTALAIGSIAIGSLTIRPKPFTTLLQDRGPAGMMARTILPLSFIIPLALGSIRLAGETAGFYGTEVGIILLTAANAAVMFSLLLITILAVLRADRDRREREAAVARSEDQYRLAEQVASVGHWRLDASDKSVTWSDEVFELVGLAKEQGVPSPEKILTMYHPEDRGAARAKLIHALKTGVGWEILTRLVRPDGEVRSVISHGICEGRAGEKVRAVFGVFADVTERENAIAEQAAAQKKVQSLQAELIHLSRLSAMEAMASTLAHELNQPLMAINNYAAGSAHMIDRGETSGLGEPLAEIIKNALRAGEIIRRLREMTKKGETVRERFIPDSVIKEAGGLASVGACKSVNLQYDFKDGLPVLGDPIQIQQVVINLIKNACDAVADGSDQNVWVTSRIVGNDTLIAVEDNGPGIPPDILSTLFEAFVTTKQDGMGVGLSISRTIIEAHGGKIWAENRPEGGARFSFTLPLAQASTRGN